MLIKFDMSLKLHLLCFFIFISVTNLFSQDCIPDQSITKSGFYPKTIEDAPVGQPYKQVLQIRVFKDTAVVIGGNPTLASIDSINVNDILGLPTGFYYTCSRKNCSYIPDSTGCATLRGNPTVGQIGEYPLGVAIEVFAKIYGNIKTTQRDTIDQFTLNITGIGGINQQFSILTKVTYPNPSNNGTFKLNKLYINELESISCFNTLGEKINHHKHNNSFSINAASGVYYATYTFKNGQQLTEKIFISQ